MANIRVIRTIATALATVAAMATTAPAQPIPGDPAPVLNRVLAYPALTNVRTRLYTLYTHASGSTADGWEVVRTILWGYDPTLPNQTVERHVAARLRHFALPNASDRVYLANVAHMIWLEWRFHGEDALERVDPDAEPVVDGMSPTVLLQPSAHLGWSLRDYSATLVDRFLVGPTWQDPNNLNNPWNPDVRQENYHFKHYKNAQAALDHMVAFHADVEWDQESAVARLIEWVGDRFAHTYESVDEPSGLDIYTGAQSRDGVQDQDLSEIYQRRIGGCGMASGVLTLLARSLNIPAAVDRPRVVEGVEDPYSRDSHVHAYLPSLAAPWVHGDGILGSGSMGLLADRLLLDPATIAANASNLLDLARLRHDEAKALLQRARGVGFSYTVNFRRSATRARSFYADNGHMARAGDWNYALARYGEMHPSFPPKSYGSDFRMVIPTQKYPLLDEVAAHWPLDGGTTYGVPDAMLPRTDGIDLAGSLRNAPSAVRGDALRFEGVGFVAVDERPVLRRNDEEMSISVWVRPDAERPRGHILTRSIGPIAAERELPSYDFAYDLRLTDDGRVEFAYQAEGGARTYRVASPNPLPRDRFSHVVVTYDSTDHARLWVDGAEVAAEPAAGRLPMADVSYDEHGNLRYFAYPAFTSIGMSLVGDLDDVILYFGALAADEVEDLYQSYQR